MAALKKMAALKSAAAKENGEIRRRMTARCAAKTRQKAAAQKISAADWRGGSSESMKPKAAQLANADI